MPLGFDEFSSRENDDISRWSSTLSIAKITRWGGMLLNGRQKFII